MSTLFAPSILKLVNDVSKYMSKLKQTCQTHHFCWRINGQITKYLCILISLTFTNFKSQFMKIGFLLQKRPAIALSRHPKAPQTLTTLRIRSRIRSKSGHLTPLNTNAFSCIFLWVIQMVRTFSYLPSKHIFAIYFGFSYVGDKTKIRYFIYSPGFCTKWNEK